MPCLIPSDMAQLRTIADGDAAASCDKGSRTVAVYIKALRPPGTVPLIELFTLVAFTGSSFASVLARLNNSDKEGGWNQYIEKVRNEFSSAATSAIVNRLTPRSAALCRGRRQRPPHQRCRPHRIFHRPQR